MTREEAIAIIENEKECVNRANKNDYCNRDCYNCELVKTDTEILTALDMAIKVLEQEPTDDATLKDIFCMGCEYKEQEPCEDCVSRIEALNSLDKVENKDSWYRLTDVMKMIRNLPPINPQPKTGHWEEYGHNISDSYIWDGVRCSVCKKDARVKTRFIKREPVIWDRDYFELTSYCPHCGAKMEVEE